MAVTFQTTEYKLIYVFCRKEITDALKIGKASVEAYDVNELTPNCEALNNAAHKRIKEETVTAAVDYDLIYTEVAYFEDNDGRKCSFIDNDVHDVLLHSGYERKELNINGSIPKDWFKVDLKTVKKAIAAVKNGQEVIDGPPIEKEEKPEIFFRDEQKRAIKETIIQFTTGNKMLWNAKMRFGKTLCALELIRRQNYGRTLILTHRPAVREGWFEDYHQLPFENYQYGSKNGDRFAFCNKKDKTGKDFKTLEEQYKGDNGKHYLYFASMQDLRGSKNVSDKGIDKNNDVFKTDWDLIILDEAHEGTETSLGKNVLKQLTKKRTPYLLYLSGTPFKILKHFEADEIFTWDYVMEQDAKELWEEKHPEEPNPYEGLARLNIFTYDLADVFDISGYIKSDEDFFHFAEFFCVWTGDERKDGGPMPSEEYEGKFVHRHDVEMFLDRLCVEENGNSQYPFSNEQFRTALSHTLWMLPGVKEAAALEEMIYQHRLHKEFGFFVINVAGEGSNIANMDEDDVRIEKQAKSILQKVKGHISQHKRTITLSCGRLTTGVSVPEWTGVFMLRGGYDVDAGNYMQTIFRGQTPLKNGAIKTNCYAFDFAPDRTATVIDEYVKSQPRTKRADGSTPSDTERIDAFLKFCPVIAMKGGRETHYEAKIFIQEVQRAYIDFVIMHGMKGHKLFKSFNDFTDGDFDMLSEIGEIFKDSGTKEKSDGKVKISENGLEGDDQTKQQRKKKSSTQKPKVVNKELEKRQKAQNVLDQIFTRLPLLLFGAVENVGHLTIEQLLSVIDKDSWREFMPEKFEQKHFREVAKLLKEDLFIASAEKIVIEAKKADELAIEERVRRIAQMLSNFHYPDHETVLTPWRVVNMHISDTLGGFDFYDERHIDPPSLAPRWVDRGDVTKWVFMSPDIQILEINSKSGVYPLYLAYTLWRLQCPQDAAREKQIAVWNHVLENNIFVVCQTKMAEKITRRVLVGFRETTCHCVTYRDGNHTLSDVLRGQGDKDSKQKLTSRLLSAKFWNIIGKRNMKFKAVVSNPPYNIGVNKEPLYHHFIDLGMELSDICTFIHPARFLFNAGKTPKAWNSKMLNDEHLRVVRYWKTAKGVFDGVTIKGGVCITLWDKTKKHPPIGTFVELDELREVVSKVWENNNLSSLSEIVYPRDLYQLTDELYKENEWAEGRQSKGHKYDLGTSVFDIFPELFYEESPNAEYMAVYGRVNNERICKWIKRAYVKLPDNIDKFKVFFPKANGSGTFGETLAEPIVGVPNMGHTVTFLSIGQFDTNEEAANLVKYIKTKFLRAMLGVLKVTQDNPKDVWARIPLQDFTPSSDIDWSQDIPSIDNQLYEKYGLDKPMRDFIDSKVKPMK